MPYSTIQELKDDIDAKIIDNNIGDISGPELNEILHGLLQFAEAPITQEELEVNVGSGESVGGSQTGEVFQAGTPLEDILRDILRKEVHPNYLMPTIVLSSNLLTYEHEAGSLISPILSRLFTQNDAGSLITSSLTLNSNPISSSFPYTDTDRELGDGAYIYRVSATYAQGPVKNNNLGEADPIGQIAAGTVQSNIITYYGRRKFFAGTPSDTPETSANVRALDLLVQLNPQVGSEFTLEIPEGATSVSFAYPASLQDVSSVRYLELNSAEVKFLFTKTLIDVEGANGYAAISYKVYTYKPVEPFQTALTYKVTI